MTEKTYLKLSFSIPASEQEKWIAVLSVAGCYGFEEQESVLHAFIDPQNFDENSFRETIKDFFSEEKVEWQSELIADRDWNAEWEKSYQGIAVGGFCEVIPPFKNRNEKIRHTVIIDPRMAFGTGHHQTTRLMIRQAESLDFKGQKVLDMGCGTGVLGILAEKLGAKDVVAVDFDPWSVSNTLDNCGLNQCKRVKTILADSASQTQGDFGIIFANINRRVLLKEAGPLESALAKGGRLLLSGIYFADIPIITEQYAPFGLHLVKQLEEDEWVSLVLMRKGE